MTFFYSQPRTALITGASRGIGSTIATCLREAGVKVIAPTRKELDLASSTSIKNYINQNQGRKIDILINNAGINALNLIEQISPSDWAEMIQINLTAPLQLIQSFSSQMRHQNWGRILNVSSIFGIVTKEQRAAYSATKAGLNGLTRTAAVELGPFNILVNSICPGYVDTALTHQNNSPKQIEAIQESIPLKRMAHSEEIARLVLFLCSEANSYLTGQSIVIDGGFTCR